MTKIKATAKILATFVISDEDSDAKRFLDAAGIADTDQRGFLDTLVRELKTKGIWEKLLVAYPILGGDANKHSFNLINPTKFQVTWFNSPVHSATGVDFNGTNQFGDTGFAMPHKDGHLGVYIRENILNTNFADIGATDDTVIENLLNSGRTLLNSFIAALGSGDTSVGFGQISDTRGFSLIDNQPEITRLDAYKNGIFIGDADPGTEGAVLSTLWLGAQNNNGVIRKPSSRECAYYSVGDSLTAQENLDYFNAIQAYQTSLGRNV